MRKYAIIIAACFLGGCATGTFTTRVSVTLAGDKVLLSSQWGVLPSITVEADQRDSKVIIAASLPASAAIK